MNIDLKYILNKTVELINIPSPVGYTHNAIEWVKNELKKLGIKNYNITKKGALIAYIKGEDSNYKKMISAHVDTLGAVVKKIKKNGRLEVTNVGGFAWGSVEGENELFILSLEKHILELYFLLKLLSMFMEMLQEKCQEQKKQWK